MSVPVILAHPSGDQFEKIKQPNTIFISGLPVEVTQDQLKEHFGGIGRIKVRINFYRVDNYRGEHVNLSDWISNRLTRELTKKRSGFTKARARQR